MKEIIELNKRILSEAPGAAKMKDGLIVHRNDSVEEFAVLPDALKVELEKLRGELNALIPDDFDYVLYLATKEPFFEVEYNDGPMAGGNCPLRWKSKKSIFPQLESVDWDDMREEMIERCQIWDHMAAEAENTPSNLQSTASLQRIFDEVLEDWIQDMWDDTSKVHALVWREDEGLRSFPYESIASFKDDLPDLMTVQYSIIGVVENGMSIPASRIDEMKDEALKELEDMPISYARAARKF